MIKTLKNLPTTWGLRLHGNRLSIEEIPLKNLPTTWGLRLQILHVFHDWFTLKNLPTTWGSWQGKKKAV